jgi:mannose/fructose-specific phosphotransferase system component IIA
MSEKHFVCLITHGNFADCLKKLAEKLVTPVVDIQTYTNMTLSLEEIENDITGKIEQNKPDKSLILVDLAGGSCWLAANRVKRGNPDIAVIGGVNVPLIVSYHINCTNLNWNDLLAKIVEDGKKGIITR